MTRGGRALVVAAYGAVFGIALPAALWAAARALDAAIGWRAPVSMAGPPVLLAGLALMLGGIVQLAREGSGPPVSALPPPRLALHGPYRYVRHPIYLGFNVALFGAGLSAASPALSWIVAPGFAPLWVAYALLEERGLARRFGRRHRRYVARVGLTPRLPAATAIRVASMAAWSVAVEGGGRIPRRGAAVLASNHCCYLDPVFLSRATLRRVHFMATAEAFRRPLLRRVLESVQAVPLRRYRTDPGACREMVRLLEEGELVGMFVEGERSPLGAYEGAEPVVARTLAALRAPVVPMAVEGSYDCGPRWAGLVRPGRVTVRVGPAVRWTDAHPRRAIDDAIRSLLERDPQPLRWEGLPLARLHRVLWRCPRCLDERRWDACCLTCSACGERYRRLGGGALADGAGQVTSLAALGGRLRDAPEPGPLKAAADAAVEEDVRGPVRPLRPLGRGALVVDPARVVFDRLELPLAALRSVSVEGADTLQLATASRMWQFRLGHGSAFRLQGALDQWRRARSAAA